jgi:hypothetical protein
MSEQQPILPSGWNEEREPADRLAIVWLILAALSIVALVLWVKWT